MADYNSNTPPPRIAGPVPFRPLRHGSRATNGAEDVARTHFATDECCPEADVPYGIATPPVNMTPAAPIDPMADSPMGMESMGIGLYGGAPAPIPPNIDNGPPPADPLEATLLDGMLNGRRKGGIAG